MTTSKDGDPLAVLTLFQSSVRSQMLSPSYDDRSKRSANDKVWIAQAVAGFICARFPDCALAIDGGTTNDQIAKVLYQIASKKPSQSPRLIATNNLQIATKEWTGVEILLAGGTVRHSHQTTYGPAAAQQIGNATYDVGVVGVSGASLPELELFGTTDRESSIKLKIIEQSDRLIFPVVSDKWNRRGNRLINPVASATPSNLRFLVERWGKEVYLATAGPLDPHGRILRTLDSIARSLPDSMMVNTHWIVSEESAAVVGSQMDFEESLTREALQKRILDFQSTEVIGRIAAILHLSQNN